MSGVLMARTRCRLGLDDDELPARDNHRRHGLGDPKRLNLSPRAKRHFSYFTCHHK